CTDASLDLIEDMLEDPTTDDGEVGGTLIDPEDYVTTVALNCGEEGVALNTDTVTDFYLILPPQTFESGITVKVTCADGTVVEKSTTSPLTISRNAIQPMTMLVINGKSTEPANNEIWYTTTDGNVMTFYGNNLCDANIVSNTYVDGKGVILFDGTVTKICDSAFQGQSVQSITIPESVTEIGKGAFYQSSLSVVNFGENSQLKSIGQNAFGALYKMEEIHLPSSLINIDLPAFGLCPNLKDICSQGSVYKSALVCDSQNGSVDSHILFTEDGMDTLIVAYPANSDIESFIGSMSVGDTKILWGAFSGCKNLKEISLSRLTEIEQCNFINCSKLQCIELGSTTTIANDVFKSCSSLLSLRLPVAKSIGQLSICDNESLTEILFGCDELTVLNTVGNNNKSLQTLNIPAGVITITDSFNSDAALVNIYCKATVPPTLTNSFDSIPQTAKIYVPTESVNAYKVADGWKEYADAIVCYNF
ncbi:MAG: leucine-rich repeat protein, partial [Alistipes sp.]|nr:leucine-rich repeat protein [Alistipes sp.]